MDFDNSWDSLVKPGDATSYFEVHHDRPFEAGAREYSPVNAWWLAELSRLIYKEGREEPEPSRGDLTRQDVLARFGLSEEFRRTDVAQCAVVAPADGRFRAVVFRGSHDLIDWATNFKAVPVPWKPQGQVHEGFQEALDTVWTGLAGLLVGSEAPVFFTGHSLGAALATLAAGRYEKASQLYSFGSPFVGDEDFRGTLGHVTHYQVINNRDVVTTVPPCGTFLCAGRVHYITHQGNLLVEPTDDQIAADRLLRDRQGFVQKYLHLHFTDAPEPLADHSPVNYVAHLERAI